VNPNQSSELDFPLEKSFFAAILRRRLFISVCFILAAAGAVVSAAGLRWNEDVLDLLPSGDSLVRDYRQLLSRFGLFEQMYIDVGPGPSGNDLSQDDLLKATDALAKAMKDSALFHNVVYRLDPEDVLAGYDLLHAHRASFFTAREAQTLEGRLSPDAIRQTLTRWKQLLTESPAPMLARTLYADPLGIDESLFKRLTVTQPVGTKVDFHKGRIFSADQRHVLMIARPIAPSTDSQHSQKLIGFMNAAIAKVERDAGAGRIDIAYLSAHRFSLDNARTIKSDIARTLTISLVAICVLSLLVYRRPLFVLLALLPACFGGLVAGGLIRWVVPGVSAIAIGCGVMVVGISDDYGIHLLYHVDQIGGERRNRRDIVTLLRTLTPSLLLCVATTVFTFLVLLVSVMPGYRQLGVFAAIAILGAVAFSLLLLPSIIPLRAGRRPRPLLDLTKFFPFYHDWSRRHPRLLGVIALCLSAAPLAGIRNVRFEGDYQRLNAASPETRRDWGIVLKSFSEAMNTTSFAVFGADLEQTLQRAEALKERLARWRDKGVILDVNCVTDLVPSGATVEANQRRWREFWTPSRIDSLRDNLARASRELRMRPEAFEPFLASLRQTEPPLTLSQYQSTAFNYMLSSRLSENLSGACVLTLVRLRSQEDYFPVMEDVAKGVPGVVPYNPATFMRHMASLIVRETRTVGGLALALVSLLVAAVVRRPRTVFAILAPLLLSVLWTFGVMGLLDVQINIMNCVVTVFIFGLVVDYSIFLATAWDGASKGDRSFLTRTAGAIVISALTTIIGVGSLMFAHHPALFAIGFAASLGVSSGLIAVFLVVPALIGRTDTPKKGHCQEAGDGLH